MILLENAFGENGRKFQGDMPTDVYGLLKTFIDLVGGKKNADRAFLVLSDDAGQYLRFMSGEPAEDGFVYTVGRTGDIAPSPLPVHIGGTLQDLARAKRDPKGMPFRFTDGDSDYSIKEMQWTEEDAGDGGKVYPIFVELEKTGKKSKSGGSAYSGQVETAAAFAAALDRLGKETGRDILKEPCVARDEQTEDMFTVSPRGNGTEASTLLTLQKTFDELTVDDPEIRTFGQILDFMKSRPPKSKLFLVATKNRTYGISDVEFEAGRPPVILLKPWAELDESAAPGPDSAVDAALDTLGRDLTADEAEWDPASKTLRLRYCEVGWYGGFSGGMSGPPEPDGFPEEVRKSIEDDAESDLAKLHDALAGMGYGLGYSRADLAAAIDAAESGIRKDPDALREKRNRYGDWERAADCDVVLPVKVAADAVVAESRSERRARKAEAERRLMAEWKSYCDDEMLYW